MGAHTRKYNVIHNQPCITAQEKLAIISSFLQYCSKITLFDKSKSPLYPHTYTNNKIPNLNGPKISPQNNWAKQLLFDSLAVLVKHSQAQKVLSLTLNLSAKLQIFNT